MSFSFDFNPINGQNHFHDSWECHGTCATHRREAEDSKSCTTSDNSESLDLIKYIIIAIVLTVGFIIYLEKKIISAWPEIISALTSFLSQLNSLQHPYREVMLYYYWLVALPVNGCITIWNYLTSYPITNNSNLNLSITVASIAVYVGILIISIIIIKRYLNKHGLNWLIVCIALAPAIFSIAWFLLIKAYALAFN